MLDLKAQRFILPLTRGVDITIWFYPRNLDQKQPLSPHMANKNLKDAPLDWHRLKHISKRLVNEVLSGLTFAFGYLDDILVFSPDMILHLKHLRLLFERVRTADLKLKEVKCNFLKRHIQYVGHIVLGEGITPLSEKLNSIQKMLPRKTPKEIKQFLGLIGYYRRFVPRFSDLARPLNALTRKDVEFKWMPKCQESFKLLKTSLMTDPILTYPDPNLPYVLFTDVSKYAWACVLTQEKTHMLEEKETKLLHPITYMCGLFRGSQLNWACLTKEAYATYMFIKKLAYYLEDADVTLRSDHLPLKKFLAKNTLNSKVNNWAIEISPFRITFEYIKGIKDTLADTMSRLIEIDPQVQQEPEPEGYEFGYCTFDDLPNIEVTDIESTFNAITVLKLKIPLVITFKSSLLIMMFYQIYNKGMYSVKIS